MNPWSIISGAVSFILTWVQVELCVYFFHETTLILPNIYSIIYTFIEQFYACSISIYHVLNPTMQVLWRSLDFHAPHLEQHQMLRISTRKLVLSLFPLHLTYRTSTSIRDINVIMILMILISKQFNWCKSKKVWLESKAIYFCHTSMSYMTSYERRLVPVE